MPLQAAEHGSARIEAFLWGLLPDNSAIPQRWATRFKVSARSACALLSHVGEDCAGAIQLVRSERMSAMAEGTRASIDWLTEADVAQRLGGLRSDPAAFSLPRADASVSTLCMTLRVSCPILSSTSIA